MTVYNEDMHWLPKKWKLTGKCSVSSQHQAQCWGCLKTKLCWGIPVEVTSCCGPVADPMAYYCDDCIKDQQDIATVSLEKSDGKS